MFLEEKRVRYFWVSATVYIVSVLLPQQIIDNSKILRVVIIVGLSYPLGFYLYFRSKDENIKKNKRYYYKFLLCFFGFIINGCLLLMLLGIL